MLKLKSYTQKFRIDTRTLGLFRILLGCCAIYDLFIHKLPAIDQFYVPAAIITTEELSILAGRNAFSIFNFLLPSDILVYAFFGLAFVCYTLFAAGVQTKLTTILSFFILWNIHQRNIWCIASTDHILNYTFFWAIFLPQGEQFTFAKARLTPKLSHWIPGFAILLQIGFIYTINALTKNGEAWMNGYAVSLSCMDTMFQGPFAIWLYNSPKLAMFINYSTLALEGIMMLLILSPWQSNKLRFLAAILVPTLHWSIAIFIDVGPFPLYTLVFAILLLPNSIWKEHAKNQNYININPLGKSLLIVAINLSILVNLQTLGRWSMIADFCQKKEITFLAELPKLKFENTSFLNQNWTLYAPNPPNQNGWIIVAGKMPDGKVINIYSKNEIQFENENLAPFKSGQMRIFADNVRYYHTQINYQTIMNRWLIWEKERTKDLHPDIIEFYIILRSASVRVDDNFPLYNDGDFKILAKLKANRS